MKGFTISSVMTDKRPTWDSDDWSGDAWRVTLKYGGRKMSLDFFMGPALCREPSVEDVVECLASDASSMVNARGFEDWAADYGYDVDSRKAERAYREIVKQTERFARLVGDDFDSIVFGGQS